MKNNDKIEGQNNSEEYDSQLTEIKHQERLLHLWFKYTYKGKASTALLYEKAQEIENKLHNIHVDFKKLEGFVELKEALDFADQLHDRDTRQYHTENREILYHFMDSLKR